MSKALKESASTVYLLNMSTDTIAEVVPGFLLDRQINVLKMGRWFVAEVVPGFLLDRQINILKMGRWYV
jgi:hypothetical protein